TWRLRYGEGDRYHHQFWGQVVRWATAGKLPAGTDLVKIGTDRQRYAPDRQIQVRARLLNPDFSPVVSEDVRVSILQDKQPVATASLRYVQDSVGMYAGSAGPLAPGHYRVELSAPAARKSLEAGGVSSVSTDIMVEAACGSEEVELAADRPLMSALADITGGRVEELTMADVLLDNLPAPTVTRTAQKQILLWQNGITLALIVLLGTAEWLLRKKEGLP
ncbi:MAG TPA: hypothetical protein VM098_04685, partial [Phycisphaerae bacterium]|nr:hypothetical protein [Phycisphaerae bacterium]